MKDKVQTILSRTGLVLLGMLFGLVALEIAFRFLYPDPSPKLVNQGLRFDDVYGISFRPNAEGWNTSLRGEYSSYIKINGKGLRGREYPYEKAEGVYRILVLGDSFTAALQVAEEQTFVKRLEAHLRQQYPNTRFEVINAGVVGYGTGNQLAYFTHEGHKYRPDLVILALFTGNDILDNVSPPHYKIEQGRLIPIEANYRPDFITPPWAREGTFFRNARNFLYTHSRLYSVTIEIVTFSALQRIPALVDLLVSAGFVEATRPAINAGNIYSLISPPEEAWRMTEAIILQLKREVEAHDGQLLVAILPDETEVDPQKWAAIFDAYSDLRAKAAAVDFRPTQRIAQILDEAGILYLQLLPALQAYQAGANEPLYYKFDGHWRPAGHAAAAEAIFEYLLEHQERLRGFPDNN